MMHDAATRTAIRTFLREMTVTLQKASGVAKAADFFAQRGDIRRCVDACVRVAAEGTQSRVSQGGLKTSDRIPLLRDED